MPLNEAGPRRSNLSKSEKAEALAQIMGFGSPNPKEKQSVSQPQHFTAAEIERMRAMVAHADAQNQVTKEFDLNNPPRTNYVHQEYPKAVYRSAKHPAHPPAKRVENEEEHEAALAQGWTNEPLGEDEDDSETVLDAADVAEVAAVNTKLKKKKSAGK